MAEAKPEIQTKTQDSKRNQSYTWAEIGKHNKDDDLWLVINDQVYDLTSYSDEHPGGPIVLRNFAGATATNAFTQAAHSVNAKQNVMPKFRIGTVDLDSPIEEWQKQVPSSSPNLLYTVLTLAVIIAIIYLLANS